MSQSHSFNVEVAKNVSINAAAIYNNLLHWNQLNKSQGTNLHEGRYWTFNSVKAWKELFPYLTEKQIRTALIKLEESGYIVSGNFNKKGYDRTKWYSVNEVNSILPTGQMELPSEANAIAPQGEPIPDINTNSKPDVDNKPLSTKADPAVNEVFEYWQAAMSKQKAKLTPERRKKIKQRLDIYSTQDIKQAIDGCKSIPHNMGVNDRNTPYNDIELICRNDTNLERFRDTIIIQPTQQETLAERETRREREKQGLVDPGQCGDVLDGQYYLASE